MTLVTTMVEGTCIEEKLSLSSFLQVPKQLRNNYNDYAPYFCLKKHTHHPELSIFILLLARLEAKFPDATRD